MIRTLTVSLQALDEEALVNILTRPRNSIIKQYQKLVGLDGVKLTVEEEAVREIANTAIRLKTGARGLRSIVEDVLREIMFTAPSDVTISKVTITVDCVNGTGKPLITRDNAKTRAIAKPSKKSIKKIG